jgi:hypothetical protein
MSVERFASLPHNCAQGSEFLAAGLAKFVEKIDRTAVGSDKLADIGDWEMVNEKLIGFSTAGSTDMHGRPNSRHFFSKA